MQQIQEKQQYAKSYKYDIVEDFNRVLRLLHNLNDKQKSLLKETFNLASGDKGIEVAINSKLSADDIGIITKKILENTVDALVLTGQLHNLSNIFYVMARNCFGNISYRDARDMVPMIEKISSILSSEAINNLNKEGQEGQYGMKLLNNVGQIFWHELRGTNRERTDILAKSSNDSFLKHLYAATQFEQAIQCFSANSLGSNQHSDYDIVLIPGATLPHVKSLLDGFFKEGKLQTKEIIILAGYRDIFSVEIGYLVPYFEHYNPSSLDKIHQILEQSNKDLGEIKRLAKESNIALPGEIEFMKLLAEQYGNIVSTKVYSPSEPPTNGVRHRGEEVFRGFSKSDLFKEMTKKQPGLIMLFYTSQLFLYQIIEFNYAMLLNLGQNQEISIYSKKYSNQKEIEQHMQKDPTKVCALLNTELFGLINTISNTFNTEKLQKMQVSMREMPQYYSSEVSKLIGHLTGSREDFQKKYDEVIQKIHCAASDSIGSRQFILR